MRCNKLPSAEAILNDKYPHLAAVLKKIDVDQIQKVINAQFAINEIDVERESVENRFHVTPEGYYGGENSEYAKWQNILSKEQKIIEELNSNEELFVDSKLLLSDDIRTADVKNSPTLIAYHEQLYAEISRFPIRIKINPDVLNQKKQSEIFLTFFWKDWNIEHDGGLIKFMHLMQIQQLNIAYSEINISEQKRITDESIEELRRINDYMYATGKKLGTIRRWSWDRDIEVIGSIFGDAFEESTTTSTCGQIIIGLIPVVGQAADIRDLVASVNKLLETSGVDGKLQTVFAILGFLPFGDVLKFLKGGAPEIIGNIITIL